jgi:hypothetical protein
MKSMLFTAGAIVALSACAATGQPTVWGKPGVSPLDYGTDIGMCTGLAAQHGAGSGVNTAGGISGQNNVPHQEQPGRHAQQNEGGQPPAQSEAAKSGSLPANGMYSGTVSADYAQRAATQQRTQEMLAKRARAEALRSCLADRGYKEFTLTAEQHAHQYLYKLGSDPALAAAAK